MFYIFFLGSSFAQKSKVDFYIFHIHFIRGLPSYLSFIYLFHFCEWVALLSLYENSRIVLLQCKFGLLHLFICCFCFVGVKHQHEAFIVECIIVVIELLQFFCPCFEFELETFKCEYEFSKGLTQ
jgi:hypothetical protein